MRMEGRKCFFFLLKKHSDNSILRGFGLFMVIDLTEKPTRVSIELLRLVVHKGEKCKKLTDKQWGKKRLTRLRWWRMESHTVSRTSHESYGSYESDGTDTSTDHLVKMIICGFVYETVVINIYSVTWTLVCFFVLVELPL